MVYSASTSFFVPFFITFLLYARIFVVLRRRLAAMRMRRQHSLPQEVTSSRTTETGRSGWSWRLMRRKGGSVEKQGVRTTYAAELSDDQWSSGGLEVSRNNSISVARGQSNLTKSASRGPIPRLGVTPGGRNLYH